MTLEQFFEKFEVFAEVPGAVAKVRELVLELAVRGKLVQQHPIESIDPLMLRVATISGDSMDNMEHRSDAEWFSIPTGWRWVKLSALGKIIGGGTPSSQNPEYFTSNGIPWLTPADLNGFTGKYVKKGRRDLTPAGLKNSSATLLPKGAVLFSSRAPIGYVAIADTELATNQGFKSCVPHVLETNEYLYYFLLHAAPRIDDEASGTTFKEVSGKIVSEIMVPLPPLAEQRRIVAKVDELMTHCDRWESQLKERADRNAALAKAALARFADKPTPENLEYLFHGAFSVDTADLRKTILTMAVRGKLVFTSPEEIPEVNWLSAAIQNADPALPANWINLRLESVFKVVGGIQKTPSRTPRQNAFPYLGVSNVQRGYLDLTTVKQFELEAGELEKKRLEPGDLLVIEGNGSYEEIGRCARWNGEITDCVHQNHIIRCRPQESQITDYVLLFLNSSIGTSIMQQLAITSSGLYSLSVGKIKQVILPLPPLAEQKRIVAKVEELMALVDKLEALQKESQSKGIKLLDAAIEAVLKAPTVEAPTTRISMDLARAVLSAEVIHRLQSEPTMGRVKLQKILYLCEFMGHLPEIDGHYHRHQAGPYDGDLLYGVEDKLEAEGWYSKEPREAVGFWYRPLGGAGNHRPMFHQLWPAKSETLERIIDTMRLWDTEKCELFATLFAAWNDLILWDREASDEAILVEVLERWNASKTQYSRQRWLRMLHWMKTEGWVPTGFGRATAEPGLEF